MTPHYSMPPPGAGKRIFTFPIKLRVRRQYGSLSGRHDLSLRVGPHTLCAVPHTLASRRPLPMSYYRRCRTVAGRHQAHPALPHPVRQRHP